MIGEIEIPGQIYTNSISFFRSFLFFFFLVYNSITRTVQFSVNRFCELTLKKGGSN